MKLNPIGSLAAVAVLVALSPWMHLGAGGDVVHAGEGSASKTPVDGGIGINLDTIADWSPAWSFVDVFKSARPWITQIPNSTAVWDTGQTLTTNRQGWPLLQPGQAAATLMMRDLEGHYPGGLYHCFYAGKGEIEFAWDAKVVSSSAGQILLQVTPSSAGIFFKINASDPKDPIRDVHVVMPGFEDSFESQPFHPLFLERLEPFETIRFMQWQRINETPLVKWQERPTPRTYTQATSSGVAFEHMAQLVNQLDCNAWVCVPHLADDAFVRGMARLWATTMNPGHKLYLEYSNEVWNNIFPQSQYAQQQGLAQGLSGDAFEARLNFYSKRSVEIFEIFRDTFQKLGGAQPELVCVMGAQYGNPWTSETVLGFQNAAAKTDALAIAPYFGGDLGSPANLSTVLGLSTEEILEVCRQEIDTHLVDLLGAHAELAATQGVALIAYEAGQHLVGVSGMEFVPSLTAKLVDANRHWLMHQLYTQLMTRWYQHGGQSFVAFSNCGHYGTYGSWGAMERQDQPLWEAHKYRALTDWAAQH